MIQTEINHKQIVKVGINFSLACVFFLLTVFPSMAQNDNYWTPNNTGQFDNYMTIISYFVLNEVEFAGTQYEVGCFIDEECRGTYTLQEMPFMGHNYPGFLSVWGSSADNGKEIIVKIYNHTTGEVYVANEKPIFQYNANLGNDSPYAFTMSVIAYYDITILNPENGTVTASAAFSLPIAAITLTITPDMDYESEVVVAYKTGDETSSITLSGTGNIRTFTMPEFDVTVSATFKKTDDLLAVETAKMRIEAASFKIAQDSANTQEDVVGWLLNQINALVSSTGVLLTASDIAISSFSSAVAGSEVNSAGTNGSFSFIVPLQKGAARLETVMLTGTITASPVYSITTATTTNGNITSNKTLAGKGEIVSLTLSPDLGYERDLVVAYKTGNETSSITLSGTGNIRTFTMPEFDVTVSATFKKTDDLLAVETAKMRIEAASFKIAQDSANTQEDVVGWLLNQINALVSSTGVLLTASDIAISSFNSAVAGSEVNSAGTNGSFSFIVPLQKGAARLETVMLTGTITASPVYSITTATTTNGNITSNKTLAGKGEIVSLTLSPDLGYERDLVVAYKTGNETSSITLSGTGNIRTFTMPEFDVTVSATFKKTDDLLAVETAKMRIEAASFKIAQDSANTQEDVVGWLLNQINALVSSTGVLLTASDIAISSFNSAVAGSEVNSAGTNGSFSFIVPLQKGAARLETVMLTGTITASPVYSITTATTTNGNITSNKTLAGKGEIVSLTLSPDLGYERDLVVAYKTGNETSSITLSGTGNIRTFTMPEFDVTVSATFKKTDDLLAVETAKMRIEAASFKIAQDSANTQEDVVGWLLNQINALVSSTGVLLTASDIAISSFNSAVAGSEVNSAGTNGSFSFIVPLQKGAARLETVMLTGTITASPVYSITTATTTNGNITSNKTLAGKGEIVSLTLSPDLGYERDLVVAYKTGNETSSITLSGTGNIRTFTMPEFDVTVSATFKKTDDLLAVETAKMRIEAASFKIAQDSANTQEDVVGWLLNQINALVSSTGVLLTASDIAISSFSSAVAGSEVNSAGTNGSFSFIVPLQKGAARLETVMLTGTITASPVYSITTATTTNGNITSNKTLAGKGEIVSLTLSPDLGYERDLVVAYKTGNETSSITLSGTGNIRTFTMPEFDVTVSATFKKTDDLLAVETAKMRIEAASFKIAQDSANTQEDVVGWLLNQINALVSSTGVLLTASDIAISSFSSAVAGSEVNSAGTNGSFSFIVPLQKGAARLETVMLTGTITASPVYSITTATTTNGNITSNKTLAGKGEIVSLTLSPDLGYERDLVVAYKTGNETSSITLSGTGNIKTFTMPEFDVTVSATFKKTDDLLAVETAKMRIEAASFKIAQDSANTQEDVVGWLLNQINALVSSTGVLLTASDIAISSFSSAVAGSEVNSAGTNGSFSFIVPLQKGAARLETVELEGIISASPYLFRMVDLAFLDNEIIQIHNTGNVLTSELSIMLSGDHAEDFVLSTTLPGNLDINTETNVLVIPNEGLSIGNYTLTATIESADMKAVTITFTVQIVNTAVSSIPSSEINVWSSKGILNIAASSNGKANIYTICGAWIKTIEYYPSEIVQIHLKQGIYIVVTKQNKYKVPVL